MQGLLGKKVGITQVFAADGSLVPVTVLEAGPCVVVQLKNKGNDGYDAIQIGFEDGKESRLSKAAAGKFKKAGVGFKRHLKEFKQDEGDSYKMGDTVTLSVFEGVSHVDITGVTKGKGFAGVVRRHKMRGGPISHGGHSKRRVGSIGQRSYPGRIAKGKRMPGHMGHVMVTQQNLEVIELKKDDNILMVRGAVPGPTGSIVVIRKSLKKCISGKGAKRGKA